MTADMVKTVIFLGGVAAGFAACSLMSDEQRQQVQNRIRGISDSPRARQVNQAVKTAADAIADTAAAKIEDAAGSVKSAAKGSEPAGT
jgi:hypothetical protein